MIDLLVLSKETAMPVKPWNEVAPRLIDVATGRTEADLVIRGGKWINVYSGEIIPGTDIAILHSLTSFRSRNCSSAS